MPSSDWNTLFVSLTSSLPLPPQCQYRASEEENWGPLPDDNITIEAGKPLGQFMVQVVCADGSVLQNYDSVAIPKLVFVGAKVGGLFAVTRLT